MIVVADHLVGKSAGHRVAVNVKRLLLADAIKGEGQMIPGPNDRREGAGEDIPAAHGVVDRRFEDSVLEPEYIRIKGAWSHWLGEDVLLTGSGGKHDPGLQRH